MPDESVVQVIAQTAVTVYSLPVDYVFEPSLLPALMLSMLLLLIV